MKRGLPISPGVAIGRAFRIDETLPRRTPGQLDAAQLTAEADRFDTACNAVAAELDAVVDRVRQEVGEEEAGIFKTHRLLVHDPAFVSKVRGLILQQQYDAPGALQQALEDYNARFARISDPYLRERVADIRDVVSRILNHLAVEAGISQLHGSDPVVLVACEIRPSQAVMFDQFRVAGIVTEAGGSTGHAAILARSMDIPAVSGLTDLLKQIHTGDLLIVDGSEGVVLVNPGSEVESAYRKMQREYAHLHQRLIENRDQEPITRDGVRIDLLANVNNVLDAATATGVGANGVGLFRTEYVYLTHASVPSEQEQVFAYRCVFEAAPDSRVTIRTLDLGGDKQVPYIGASHEANPFLGWRSIRMSAEYPEFFQTQLRAIMRAGVYGEVKLLFPMISSVEEVQRLRQMVAVSRSALVKEGVPHASTLPFGILIEIPAAAICVDQLLDQIDFVSIGSNDLIQYLMAADRDNPKVAHLCEPFQPALYRMLRYVISTCIQRGKPVTLCGEMAGRPLCLLPLLGMGLTSISMTPALIPKVKELVRSISVADCRETVEVVAKMPTAEEVRRYLSEQLRRLAPDIAKLESL